ncbi:MAG: tetratricopeptide repeat protein [Gemmataceae bacterium]|nr:tetratricopeptide repeat protein [Gemmataceae bacterium]
MDGRVFLSLVLALAFSCCGCFGTQNRITPVGPKGDMPLPANFTLSKPKEEVKRPPKAGTVAALAVMREREAEKTDDLSVQIRLRDKAREHYQEALKLDANCREAQLGLARVYMSLQDYERAQECYRKFLDKNPKDHGLWHDLGMCFNRQKQWTKACKCFEQALAIEPENRHYLQTLGFTLARAGEVDASVTVLTKAVGPALAHYHVARMMNHTGDKDRSRAHLQLALQHNPGLTQAEQLLDAIDSGATATTPERGTLQILFQE